MPDGTPEKLQVDILGPYKVSTSHPYKYALQIQDILSRYLIMIPTEMKDADTAAQFVFEEWFLRIFPPKVMQSGRGHPKTSYIDVLRRDTGLVTRGICRDAEADAGPGALEEVHCVSDVEAALLIQ